MLTNIKSECDAPFLKSLLLARQIIFLEENWPSSDWQLGGPAILVFLEKTYFLNQVVVGGNFFMFPTEDGEARRACQLGFGGAL